MDTFAYYNALADCHKRYRSMMLEREKHLLTSADYELWFFLRQFGYSIGPRMPLMKLNRWLGYIQGCLIERGYTTVEAERNWTRPLFRPLDFKEEECDMK